MKLITILLIIPAFFLQPTMAQTSTPATDAPVENQQTTSSPAGKGNNNGNVIIVGGQSSGSVASSSPNLKSEGDATTSGQTTITIMTNDDENGDGIKGDKILTIDANSSGVTQGSGSVEGDANANGNLNGNGNGNTLLNIDYYGNEGDSKGKPRTEAHISSSSPLINTYSRYAKQILDMFNGLIN